MNKCIILSVNDNPDYLYFVPLTCWAWAKIGWDPIVMRHGGDTGSKKYFIFSIHQIGVKHIEGYRADTLTQVSRLYASAIIKDSYLMTGDIDMIPLSDYWKPDFDKISVYGHDLTGHTHYPICYIGMTSEKWREVMAFVDYYDIGVLMEEDLASMHKAKSEKFEDYWFTDQELITQKLQSFKDSIQFIDRGQYKNGYAYGRVDRGSWSLDHKQFIDAHLFQQVYHKGREEYFDKTLDLLCRIWPDEDWQWLCDYNNEFRKLTGHAN